LVSVCLVHSANISDIPDDFQFTQFLQRGSRGNEVKYLQIVLQEIVGEDIVGAADGIFGEKTETAVKEYQSMRDLAFDGKVGKNTRAKLNADLAELRGENRNPTVDSFNVSPNSVILGNSFTISYSVSDDIGLKQVELWRANDSDGSPVDWVEIDGERTHLLGKTSYSGSFSDTPSSPGTYWYGMHVVDSADNWNCEQNSQTGGNPGDYGPKKRIVNEPLPDLIVQSCSFTSSGHYYPNSSLSLNCIIKNQGQGLADSSKVKYYLSTSSTGIDYYLGSDYVKSLSSEGTSNESENLTIPSNITTDRNYYVVFYTDADGQVSESNENNNKSNAGRIYIKALNQSPLTSASDISGQPQTMEPNTVYSVTAKYYDLDGRDNLQYCYLQLRHPSKPLTMMWHEPGDWYDSWEGEEGKNYLTIVDANSVQIINGYQLTWKFKINSKWPLVNNVIDFGVYASDDDDLTTGWKYDNTNASFVIPDTTAPDNPTFCTETHGVQSGIEQNSVNDPEFTWSGASDNASGVNGYYYYWGTDSSGTSSNFTTFVGYDPPAVSPGIYYLRVKTKDNAGNEAPWATLFIFIYQKLQPVEVQVQPDKQEINIDETTTIDMQIEQATNFGGFELKFRYNPNIIEISTDDVQLGDFLPQNKFHPLGPHIRASGSFNELAYGASLLGSDSGQTGNGTLARITVKGVSVGTTSLELQEVLIIDASSEMNPLPVNTTDSAITVEDTMPPETFIYLSGSQGDNGWYVSNVTVILSATDSGSGVKSTKYKIGSGSWQTYSSSFQLTTEGITTVNYYSVDNADNQEEQQSREIKIDKTSPPAPVISSSTHNEDEPSNNKNPSFSWTEPTDTSGISGYSYIFDHSPSTTPETTSESINRSKSYTNVDDRIWYFHVRAKDGAGRWGNADHYGPVKIETTPSVILFTPNGSEKIAGGSSIDITWNATGSGIDHIHLLYSTDNGINYQDIVVNTDNDGIYSWTTPTIDFSTVRVKAEACDIGNQSLAEDASDNDFTIDSTTPETTIILSGTEGNNDWYTSNVTVELNATDNLSGIKEAKYKINSSWNTYSSPFIISDEGTTRVYYYSEDNAGNTESQNSQEIKIDKTFPTITSQDPLLDADSVAIATNIQVTFSEPMDPNIPEGTFLINPSTDGSISWQDNTLSFNPSSNLAYGTQYTITINNLVKDLAGNPLSSIVTWHFNTAYFFADVNCDNKVNVFDVLLVATCWNTSDCDTDYKAEYDLNKDGNIDLFDLTTVAGYWGKEAPFDEVSTNPSLASLDQTLPTQSITLQADSPYIRVGKSVCFDLIAQGNSPVQAFELQLSYDPNYLSFPTVSQGELFYQKDENTVISLGPKCDESQGKITFGGILLGNNSQDNTSGTIARLEFMPKQAGELQLEVNELKLVNSRWNYLPIKIDKHIPQMILPQAPKTSALLPNYPNPFNPDTWIPYQLSKDGYAAIRIYNIKGQLIRKLNLGNKPASYYLDKSEAAYWDGKNDTGEKAASGIYFYQLQSSDFRATRRMLILK